MEIVQDHPGEPDGFERLWTPHRGVYVSGEKRPATQDAGESCPFCTVPDRSDEDALIVHRGREAYVILNLYPYNPGHMLVCPYRHVADYTELTPSETAEIAELTQQAMRVVRAASNPAGINLGMNQGSVAGAGIAGHLHQHIVPRWLGDMNFLPIVAQTKAVPQLLSQTRELLAATWSQLESRNEVDS